MLGCCLNQNIFLSLSFSLSPSLTLSLSNPASPSIPGVILYDISQLGEQFKSLQNIFPPGSYPTTKLKSVVQNYLLCRNRDIPTQAIVPSLFPLSAHHSYSLTTSCVLQSTWFQISLKDKNFFIHVHINALARISFPRQITPGSSFLLDFVGSWASGLMLGGI